jgi:hypothetical protein
MNLSWFDLQASELATDLIAEQSTLDINYGTTTTAYKDMWVQNNGDESLTPYLLDFGFYISSDTPEDVIPLYKLAAESDGDGLPYGLFLIFGYTDEFGTVSNIDEFEEGNLAAEEMAKFQINWQQGSSALRKLELETAYTYSGSVGYVKRNTLPTTYPGTSNAQGENRGKLKIRLALRYPSTGPTYTSNITLNAYALDYTGDE